MKFNKLIAAMSAVTMLGSLAVAVPASAAETDASVTAFDNFRVYVSGTSKTKTEGDITYYANAHIGNVLTGEGYNGGTINKTETTVSSRFYNLMRIAIPSGNTKSVTISVASASNNKAFEIYSYSSAVEWMNLAYTDNNHAGITADDYQTYYDASTAAGYDWSGLNTNTFTTVSPITTATTASGKLTFTLSKADGSLTADDLAAGYKDILIKNASGSACNLTAPQTPEVTTELDVVADPVAKIGSTEYASFDTAYAAAKDGDTIELLDDVSFDARLKIEKAVTITGTDKTRTVANNDILVTKNVTIDGVDVVTKSQLKIDANNVTLTVKNADVTGGIYLGKVNGTLVLDSANVDKVTTRNGADAAATVTKNTVSGSANIGELVYYSDTDVIDDALTVTTKTDTYVAPVTTHSEYFSFAGDENVSYNAVAVTASNGSEEQTKTASIVAITGASEIFAEVKNIPEGITITGIVLDSVE